MVEESKAYFVSFSMYMLGKINVSCGGSGGFFSGIFFIGVNQTF